MASCARDVSPVLLSPSLSRGHCGAGRPACQFHPPEDGHWVVSGLIDAGTLACGLASAGEMITNPLLRMIACPCGPITKLMNFWPSAALGALVGMVSP